MRVWLRGLFAVMAAPCLLAANSAALANELFVTRSTNKEPEQLH
jgi:hypothetical protein